VDALPVACDLLLPRIYSKVRHPLYLAESVATLGVLLQYRSMGAEQLWRMHEEEKVLEAQSPEYGEYRRRTARLVPGVY
jgi:protein-S-isoprenylcysteine O-methyltransferase Ste14